MNSRQVSKTVQNLSGARVSAKLSGGRCLGSRPERFELDDSESASITEQDELDISEGASVAATFSTGSSAGRAAAPLASRKRTRVIDNTDDPAAPLVVVVPLASTTTSELALMVDLTAGGREDAAASNLVSAHTDGRDDALTRVLCWSQPRYVPSRSEPVVVVGTDGRSEVASFRDGTAETWSATAAMLTSRRDAAA